MEQTVNTFKGGLQSDTNPMVQGNDSLSDALNATFVTMNGNEIVLQNDMGNRRVDNAYLPAGYEPVGIKEYGGIIYIAAYNPITNKSLIGSFPSPLYRYGESNNLTAQYNDSVFTESFTDLEFNGINFLKNFVLLVPFLDLNNERVILHAGDKFTVYGGGLSSTNVTNYNNVSGNKLISPKNKKYTISLGVLNSLNEFVDFTSSLLRWNGSSIVNFDEGTPDYIKFNTGYFIPSSYSPPTGFDYTILDLLFVKNRLKCSANTYAYKLVGPLYLRIEMNIIENLTYNIYGNKNEEGTGSEIQIELIYEYNCPDGGTGGTGNEKYVSFDEATKGATLTVKSNIFIDGSNISEKLIDDVKYNEETNLYKAIKLAEGKLSKIEGNVPLMIVPLTSNNLGIRNLSIIDNIDLSKLSSNEIELTDFRYYTNLDTNITNITVGFKSYPKYKNSFLNLKIEILDGETVLKTFVWGESGYNGVKTFSWDFPEKSRFYPVKISYTIHDENKAENDQPDPVEIYRWIMTTKLLNSCFYKASDSFVRDFGKIDKETKKFEDSIEKLLNIYTSFNIESNNETENIEIFRDGDFFPFKTTNEKLNSKVVQVYLEDIDMKGKFSLDRDLFPTDVELTGVTVSDPELKLLNGESNFYEGEEYNDKLFPIEYEKDDITYKVKLDLEKTSEGVNYNIKYKSDFIGIESYSQDVKQKTVTIENLLIPFYKTIDNEIGVNTPYATICLDSWDRSGTDEHAIYFSAQNSASKYIVDFSGDPEIDNGAAYDSAKIINQTGERIAVNHDYTFSYSAEKEFINQGIDSVMGGKICFIGTNNTYMKCYNTIFLELSDQDEHADCCAPRPLMFWMRTTEGWGLMPIKKWNTSKGWPNGVGQIDLENGWLGQTAHNNRNLLNHNAIKGFIKKRIKNFYYMTDGETRDLYTLDSAKPSTVISENKTLSIKILSKNKVSEINENSNNKGNIQKVLEGTGKNNFFIKSNEELETEIFNKNIIFLKTEEFEILLQQLQEYSKKGVIAVALEHQEYDSNNNPTGSTKLMFLDSNNNEFNTNTLYIYEDNVFKPLNVKISYDGGLLLLSPEHTYCGIDWMYATDDADYLGDDNDETYLNMGGVPTIPKALLK